MPSSMTARGPARSISRPISGLTKPETTKPKEKAPAVTPRSQPHSERIRSDATLHDRAGPGAIHQPADQRTHEARDHKAEGEGTRGDTAVPAELGEDQIGCHAP